MRPLLAGAFPVTYASLDPETALAEALADFIPEEELGSWLEEPNPGFGDRKPIKVIESGETEKSVKSTGMTSCNRIESRF